MKVKKFLFAGALLVIALFSVNSVMAETPPTTDNVIVSLKFKPIQSITVNADSVNLIYATVNDYSVGKSSEALDDHITIYSTGGFQVKVKAAGDFTNSGTGGGSISLEDVEISAIEGTNAPTSTTIATDEPLVTSEDLILVSAATGGTNINYNVVYNNTGGAGNNYIDKYIYEDGAESVYSTTVTYTIEAN